MLHSLNPIILRISSLISLGIGVAAKMNYGYILIWPLIGPVGDDVYHSIDTKSIFLGSLQIMFKSSAKRRWYNMHSIIRSVNLVLDPVGLNIKIRISHI